MTSSLSNPYARAPIDAAVVAIEAAAVVVVPAILLVGKRYVPRMTEPLFAMYSPEITRSWKSPPVKGPAVMKPIKKMRDH